MTQLIWLRRHSAQVYIQNLLIFVVIKRVRGLISKKKKTKLDRFRHAKFAASQNMGLLWHMAEINRVGAFMGCRFLQ